MTDTLKGIGTEALRTRALRVINDRLRGEERELLLELLRLYENGLRAAQMFSAYRSEAPRSEPRQPPPVY